MSDGSDVLVGCQVRFGDDLPVGMSLVDALQARLILACAGFRGLEQAPCYDCHDRPLPGQFKIEWPDPLCPGVMVPVYTLAEARKMAASSYHLPIGPAVRRGDTPVRRAERVGQRVLDELGVRVVR